MVERFNESEHLRRADIHEGALHKSVCTLALVRVGKLLHPVGEALDEPNSCKKILITYPTNWGNFEINTK